jgi:ADP-ribosyl-[dinitrogen reductase] hydrolase
MNASSAASSALPLRHCYWVIPGLLLAGEHPGGSSRDKTKDRLKKLLGAGIECFVDLTKPTELPRYDTFLPFYVEYARKAIKDHGLPASRDQMVEILEYLGNAVRAGRPVYVHCRAGIGRTGTVVGCFLVERGFAGDGALDELNRLWQQSKRSRTWAFIPETEAQASYVREWQRSLGGSGLELSPTAAAVAGVSPISAPGDLRLGGASGGVSIADVQARAASQATGAGQARAAMQNIAADKKRKGSRAPGPFAGGGLAAAATQARAAVEAGIAPAPPRSAASQSPRAPAAASPPVPPQGDLDATQPQPALPRQIDSSGPATIPPARARASSPEAGQSPAQTKGGAPTPRQPSAAGDLAALEATVELRYSELLSRQVESETGAASRHPAAEKARPELDSLQQITEQARRDLDSVRSAAEQSREVFAPPAVGRPGVAGLPVVADLGATADMADPLLDPETLMAARAMRERFVGVLLGLAVGDAVAAATQYRRPGTFTPVGDMIGGGPFDLPRGAWSDDTAMALCLAESLLECNGFDARDQIQRYARWQQEGYLSATGQCVGITANTARSLAIAQWRRVVFPGSHDPDQLDPEPLSRIASIPLYYFASLETTLQQAAEASRTTCQAPAVLDACRMLGGALHAALSGQPKERILAEAGPMAKPPIEESNSAATALAAAVWAFGSTDNFRDAILRAANVGGNSDVVASICGQLAGAHYGFSAIPPSWRNGLMHKDLIESYADRLLACALVCLSGAPPPV